MFLTRYMTSRTTHIGVLVKLCLQRFMSSPAAAAGFSLLMFMCNLRPTFAELLCAGKVWTSVCDGVCDDVCDCWLHRFPSQTLRHNSHLPTCTCFQKYSHFVSSNKTRNETLKSSLLSKVCLNFLKRSKAFNQSRQKSERLKSLKQFLTQVTF